MGRGEIKSFHVLGLAGFGLHAEEVKAFDQCSGTYKGEDFANSYCMIDKIRKILKNEYELTQEEVKLEDKIWHEWICACWGIDTEAEPTESEAEAKRKQKEYNHNYYVTHRKKQSTKVLDMSTESVRRRATMAKLRSRICEYEGERIKYSTLMARLHNKMRYSWPDAKKIADEHIVKEDENHAQ